MTRLIDADALLKPTGCYNPVKYTYEYGLVVTVDDIKAAETKAERQKGKWIPNDTLFHHGKTSWRCSVCNDVIDDVPTCMNKPLYKFCPNCGADMREADNDKVN